MAIWDLSPHSASIVIVKLCTKILERKPRAVGSLPREPPASRLPFFSCSSFFRSSSPTCLQCAVELLQY